jgi:hypothetical protein
VSRVTLENDFIILETDTSIGYVYLQLLLRKTQNFGETDFGNFLKHHFRVCLLCKNKEVPIAVREGLRILEPNFYRD